MVLRFVLTICLSMASVLSAGPAQADLSDSQPSYTRIAAKCGDDPSQPGFSSIEYTQALLDAKKALKEAKAAGSRVRQNAITAQVAVVTECMKQERNHYHIPKIRTCDEFTDHFYSVSAWSALALSQGRITQEYRDRLFSLLRAPAEECIRKLMSSCIDPNSASAVDDALRAMEAAAPFGFLYSEKSSDALLDLFGPTKLRLTFCTDTDYSCKKDPDYCAFKKDRIKAMMQAYLEK